MRTKLKITEGIFPMPVLMVATYNEDNSVNVMNAAWGTMQARDIVALNLTETHKTVQNIKTYSAYGCPYVQENCDVQKPSDNIIIYGHHQKERWLWRIN